jgi:cystathionine gamma-synthase
VTPPVHLTATYRFDDSDDLIDVVQNRSGFIYSRWDNPTVVAAENQLAALEGYPRAVGFGSGMAAITTTILALAKSGDTILTTREIYGGTHEFMEKVLHGLGIHVVFVNCQEKKRLLAEIRKGPRLLYLESPTNPLLRVLDVRQLARTARENNVTTLLDATFASPVNQQPVKWGVDITLHSATKYLGGHHDVTAGFACCSDRLFKPIWNLRKILGGIMDPMSAFLLIRGMQTLSLRVRRQNDNALAIARFLESHEAVSVVHYPGLASHPDYEVAHDQLSGCGGMLSFELAGDFEKTKDFMDRLHTIKLATSLGGVTSLANQPITNTHAGLSPEDRRKKAGVSENLVRLSVGIEDSDLLIADLSRALEIIR